MTTTVDSVTPSTEGLCAGYTTNNGISFTCVAFCGAGNGAFYTYSGTGTVASTYLNWGSLVISSCANQTSTYSNTDTVYAR